MSETKTQHFWGGIVPEDWKIVKAKHVLQHHNRKVKSEDGIVTVFRDGQVTLRTNRRTEGFTSSTKEIGYHHVCKGDLVIHSMDGGFGAIGVSDSEGKVSPVAHIYTSNVADLYFVAHQLRTAAALGWIAANGKGIRVRSTQFDRPLLNEIKLALPPLATQHAIADHLDRETAEIDGMRADLDNMERLLEERRQVIKARYFDSSTSHTAVKVKYIATINTGSGDTQDAIEDGQYSFYVRSDTVLSSNQWEFNGPAVLTAGDGAGVGKIFHYAEGKFKVHQRVYCIHGFRDVDPMYFFRAFSYLLPKEVLYGGASSTVASLRMHMLEDLQIPLPPLAEQRRIAGEINRDTSEINSMLEDIRKLRDLLAERRAAVISAAVTGQIDIPSSPTTKDESHA